ncbi:MAG: hypothetical protein ACTTH8_01455 [Treponema sp.]
MKFKDTNKHFIIFPLIFLVIYMFTATVPLGSDVYFLPVWVRTIAPDSAQAELAGMTGDKLFSICAEPEAFAAESPKAFISGSRFGYFTESGTLLRSEVIKNNVSLSSEMWTAYSENALKTPVYRPNGELFTTIDKAGFIHIDEQRLYLFEPGGNIVAYYNTDGQQVWRYAHTAAITAFHSAAMGTVIGYSDGRLVYLNNEGVPLLDLYPGGSNYQIILGAALSEDGRFIACLCGIDRQRALLIRVEKNKYKIVQHQYLKDSLRKQLFVDFDKDGNNAFFECSDGIGIFDCRHFSTGILPVKGTITASGLHPYKNITTVITQNEQSAVLSIVETPMHLIGSTTFPSKNTFLIQERDSLYVATDRSLARIDIKGVY